MSKLSRWLLVRLFSTPSKFLGDIRDGDDCPSRCLDELLSLSFLLSLSLPYHPRLSFLFLFVIISFFYLFLNCKIILTIQTLWNRLTTSRLYSLPANCLVHFQEIYKYKSCSLSVPPLHHIPMTPSQTFPCDFTKILSFRV